MEPKCFSLNPLAKAALLSLIQREVALAHVEDAHRVVQEMVQLPLDQGLEIGLHAAAGHLHHDPRFIWLPGLSCRYPAR